VNASTIVFLTVHLLFIEITREQTITQRAKAETMTKQVLILDDNADNRQLLYFALMAGDYEIHQAEQGSDAIKLMENTSFDMALLDIELPDADGLELGITLRQRYPEVVLIMLSANDNAEFMKKARQIGASAYVVKPFNLPKVLELLAEFEKQADRTDSRMRVIGNRY
jgi:CheY-like chemotaxis protein